MNLIEARNIAKDWFRLCPQSRNHVHCRGEALSQILWQGTQWAVTTYGLECRDGTYHVPIQNLFGYVHVPKGRKKTKQDVMVFWFEHLSGKNWCDEDDIDHALQAALVLFNMDGTRTNVEAPFLMDEHEIEQAALDDAERAYRATKDRLIYGAPA